jgi:hypothetical protein
MKTIFFVVLLTLFSFNCNVYAFDLKGVVKCKTKHLPIQGVSIINKTSKKVAISDQDGLFSITGKLGDKIVFKLMGYQNYTQVLTSDSAFLLVEMTADEKLLKSVNITANRNSSLQTSQSSVITLTAKQMNNLPTIGGERDVIRAMQLMPGVKRGGDGAAGIFVRGGTADQNLVLMDGAPVYNPSHILGFFSIFNNDALQEAKLFKGAFPANYGGRLSAVMDVKMRDGNFVKWNTEAGVGLLSAKVKVEGPIVKDKVSLLVATRRTYLDKVFQVVGNQLPYYFYDFNTKLNFKINTYQKISFSNYWGNDVLSILETPTNNNSGLGIDFGTQLGNNVSSLKWSHTKNNASTNLLVSHSYFAYHVNAAIQNTNFTLKSVLNDFSFKADYSKMFNKLHTVKFGLDGTRLLVSPNQSTFKGSVNETLKADAAQFFNNNQINFYALHDYVFSKKITFNYGVRLSSSFNTNYLYLIPEPRLAVKYSLNQKSALKLAYNKMSQHVHFVSSSSALMPTDLWYPVTQNVKPQTAHQISVSFEKELPTQGLFLQVECYYKWMQNLVEYKEGTQILLNNKVEDDLIQGVGKANGFEIMLSKKEGKFTGWFAYTLAWSSRQFDELNNGNPFFTRYDRRHDFSIVGNYNFNKRMSFSANYVWASGSRVTPIVGQFLMPSGSYNDVLTMPIYGSRNSLVLSPTHRLDINWVIKSKPEKKHQSEWHIGAYNVYNQTQAFKTKIEPNGQGNLNYKQIGLFGFIPSIAFNIKF